MDEPANPPDDESALEPESGRQGPRVERAARTFSIDSNVPWPPKARWRLVGLWVACTACLLFAYVRAGGWIEGLEGLETADRK